MQGSCIPGQRTHLCNQSTLKDRVHGEHEFSPHALCKVPQQPVNKSQNVNQHRNKHQLTQTSS